ncbi:MAG: VWA domain-containing protein [Acidobacteriota bacterium]|nr:VWA domain-containing protein [Acidobacteriota bacterium]
MRTLPVLLLMAATAVSPAASSSAAQVEAPSSERAAKSTSGAGPDFRVSVNLAQTDVVVVDRSGRPVRDLEARDFELLDNGKIQTITNFSWVDAVPPPNARPARDAASLSLLPASIPHREDLRRAMVMLVDDAGTSTADLAAILPMLRRFVSEQIQPGDLAAFMASRGGMGLFERLTSDKRQLYAAIERIGQRPAWLSCDYVPPFVPEKNAELFHYVPGDFILTPNACPPADKNGSLRRAIQSLSALPGRKAVIIFSHAFGGSPDIVSVANRAGVALYVLDPTGGRAARVRLPGSIEAANTLATETGGFRKLSSPSEIGKDIAGVLSEMSGYYVLGYHAAPEDLAARERSSAHSIHVRVLRDGLVARSRTGLPNMEPETPERTPQTGEEILRQILQSPVDTGNLRVSIEPTYTAALRDPKSGRRGADFRIYLKVENALRADRSSVGLDALIAAFHSDGTIAASVEKNVTLANLAPRQAEQFRRFGILLSARLGVLDRGDYQIRVALRDPEHNESGSGYAFISLPDFNKGPLQLATPDLGPSPWNLFAAGDTVPVSCEVFGPAAAKVTGSVQLYSEKGPVGPPHTTQLEVRDGHYSLSGTVSLPRELTPGEYAIELVAWDRTPRTGKPVSLSWSRFEVVK